MNISNADECVSEAPRVAVIVPGHRGSVCGITDYGFWLARAGVDTGAEVILIALTSIDEAVAGYREKIPSSQRGRFECSDLSGAGDRYRALERVLQRFRPNWISLQFDPLMFREGKFFVFSMLKIGQILRGQAPLLVTVHETAEVLLAGATENKPLLYRFRRWECSFGLNKMKAKRYFASTDLQISNLAQMGLSAERLPILNNIPRVEDAKVNWPLGLPGDARIALVFGRIDPLWNPDLVLGALRNEYLERLAIVSVGEVGYHGEGWARLEVQSGDIPCFKLGYLPAEELSAWLSQADVGISTTRFQQWSKSGSCAAMIEHDLPIVFSDSPPPDEMVWPPQFAVAEGDELRWLEVPQERVSERVTAQSLWLAMFGVERVRGGEKVVARDEPDTGQTSRGSKRPKVSVLINNYNNGRWLRGCVESVLNQTFPADEIIVYDDGSSDDSISILRAFEDQIHVIEGAHVDDQPGIVSQGAALAGAFAVSTGDHLYLLDGDDKFSPGKIEAFERVWRAHPSATLIQSPMVLVNELGVFERENYDGRKHCEDYRKAIYRDQDCDLFYASSALAFSRNYLAMELPLDYSTLQDAAIDARLAPGAAFFGPVFTLDECHTVWQQRDNSLSRDEVQRNPFSATMRRYRVFSDFTRRHSLRPIRLWRNARLYRQLARKFAPNWLSEPFARNPEGKR